MILTITPNPSLDYLFQTGHLVWDDANRVAAPRCRPGGQGINVTRAARVLGASSVAVALLGGRVGDELQRMLAAEGTPCDRIDIGGDTRVFVGARETETGRSMLLNPRGPHIDAQECERIVEALIASTRRDARWVVVCGSVPPGLPIDVYARIGAAARSRNQNFVPDCDGEALKLAAPYATLLVPNQHEAERLLEVRIGNLKEAAQAARQLHKFGAPFAAITLGDQGALLSDGKNVWSAAAPRVDQGSAVGAGDAFLAALLFQLDQNAETPEALRHAVAAGSAVLHSKGSDLLELETAQRLYQMIEALEE